MEKQKNSKSKILILIAIFALIVVGGIYGTRNLGQTTTEKSYSKSVSYLNKYLKDINVQNGTPIKSTVNIGQNTLKDELPEISQYPFSIEGNGDINIEIFSSPEKAGEGTDGWLNEVAKKFNSAGYKVGDKSVSVSVRSIASGVAVDYITSGKYIPQAFTPSNELWGDMATAGGAKLNKVNDSLVKNTAGILLSKSTYDKLKSSYGNVDLAAVVQATTKNEISLGYTNKPLTTFVFAYMITCNPLIGNLIGGKITSFIGGYNDKNSLFKKS